MKHLKRFNELYDSEEAKKLEVSPEELKKMVSMDYKHSYEPGKWYGKNSADLNVGVSDYISGDKYTKFERIGILDKLHKLATETIPELKDFKFNNDGTDSHTEFDYRKEVTLDFPNFIDDDNLVIKLSLWIKYRFQEDEYFKEEEPKYSIVVFFAPTILMNEKLPSLLKDVEKEKCKDDNCELQANLSKNKNDNINRIYKKLLIASEETPEESDAKFADNLGYSERALTSIDDYKKALIKVKSNLYKISDYIKNKYGISIL